MFEQYSSIQKEFSNNCLIILKLKKEYQNEIINNNSKEDEDKDGNNKTKINIKKRLIIDNAPHKLSNYKKVHLLSSKTNNLAPTNQ